MTHELKTWPEQYQALIDGRKTHEVRRADRPFHIGDVLYLREWQPDMERYTGRESFWTITWMTNAGTFRLPADVCVMSIKRNGLDGA